MTVEKKKIERGVPLSKPVQDCRDPFGFKAICPCTDGRVGTKEALACFNDLFITIFTWIGWTG